MAFGLVHYNNPEVDLFGSLSLIYFIAVGVFFKQLKTLFYFQKVYLHNQKSVFKLNDSIYYNSWEDYFHNLLLHNTFFEDTAYQLSGFHTENDNLFAVVEQPFVEVTSTTNLEHIKEFLLRNGFSNTRNNDYYNQELGLILEDLHDENVLTKDGLLYFIDTVFYLTDEFWMDFNNLKYSIRLRLV